MSAEFIHKFTPGKLPVTVLLLHGTGGDEDDLLPVGRALAPGAAFLSPRGKVLEHGMPRFFARKAPGVWDAGEVEARAAELAEWITSACVTYQIDPARLFALGYSNGGNIAAALMLLHPGVLAGAVLLRATLPLEPAVLPALNAVPVLISAGASDAHVTPSGAEALGLLLTKAGAHVDIAMQNAGHELTPADFNLGKQWFARLLV